jgi:catechol 2,3-dioxygenase-like lactoylglutathione lyase family enzyme
MTQVELHPDDRTDRSPSLVDMKLEVVVVPVADVDRAKRFYGALGWRLDIDHAASETFRVVEFTPPGSGASIIFGTGITNAAPGSIQDLQLVVSDIEVARADLVRRGVAVSEVFHDRGGVFHHGGDAERVDGPDPGRRSYASFASFSDPDGNGWILQEVTQRLPGRMPAGQVSFAGWADLEAALRRAAAAHGQHEQQLGRPDPEWRAWYAHYIVREQVGADLPA